MRRATRWLAVLLLLAVAACSPGMPGLTAGAAAIPPVPPGQARFYFYRFLEPYETTAMAAIDLNGSAVGVSQGGAVFYRDVPPGRYTITVPLSESYPDQFKTVTVGPGQVYYFRIESLSSYKSSCGVLYCHKDTFVVAVVAPAVGAGEIRPLALIPG